MSELAEQHKAWTSVRARLLYPPQPLAEPNRRRPVSPFHSSRQTFPSISGTVAAHFAFDQPPIETFAVAEPPWKLIAKEVALKHGVSLRDMISPRRDRPSVQARHEAFWRCRHETTMSLPQIGQKFGRRDHTTVLHGVRKHQQRMEAAGVS